VVAEPRRDHQGVRARAEDDLLSSPERISIIGALRTRGDIPFFMGECQMALPFHYRRQHRLPLGRRAQGGDEAAAQHHRCEIGFDDEMLAECFHENGVFDRAAAAAAVLRRERQAEPAERGEFGPQFRAPARLAVCDPLEGAIVVALGQELLGAVAQDDLLGIVAKIHGVVPRVSVPSQHRSPG
jgi:hypothetical protein